MGVMTELRDHDDAVAYAEGLYAGERVRLRGTLDSELATLAEWMTDPSIRVTQARYAAVPSERSAREIVSEWSANKATDVGFSIETVGAEPTLVGHVGLFGTDNKDRCGTVGIVIGPPYLGQGYGTDAMRLIVGFGFRELGLHRIQLDVYAFNVRAIAAYRKAGFVEEGRARQLVHHDGRWYDNVQMSILEHEWWDARG
jgi:RimJ/RimL family protein N-acetyltransferase